MGDIQTLCACITKLHLSDSMQNNTWYNASLLQKLIHDGIISHLVEHFVDSITMRIARILWTWIDYTCT